MGIGGKGLRVFAVAAMLVAAPASVFAHARLITPKPRTTGDGLKAGPCGAVPRTATPTDVNSGAEVTVTFEETIDHGGCFDFVLATETTDPTTNAGWKRLLRVNDPFDGGGTITGGYRRTAKVQLPVGVTCTACTLALRQVMNIQNAPCNDNTPDEMDGGPDTYFSCADIRIVDSGAPPLSEDGGTTDPEDGGTTDPDDDGGTDPGNNPGSSGNNGGGGRRPNAAADDGCSVGWGAGSTASAAAGLAIAGLAIVRRRRRR